MPKKITTIMENKHIRLPKTFCKKIQKTADRRGATFNAVIVDYLDTVLNPQDTPRGTQT